MRLGTLPPHGLSPKTLETLRALGLTEYAARCYVALLTLRSAEASAIADAAEVPRTKVYATLKDLVDAGWVVADHGRPVTYRPVAPDERLAQAEKSIQQATADATRELQARFASSMDLLTLSLYLLREPAAIVRKAVELVDRARHDVLVALPFLAPGEDAPLAEALARARRRGVAVRIMAAPDLVAPRLAHELEGARLAVLPFQVFLPDGKQALLVLPTPQGPLGAWNPTEASVEIMGPVLLGVWERAPPR